MFIHKAKGEKVQEGFHFKCLAKFKHIRNKTNMMVGETNLGIVMKALQIVSLKLHVDNYVAF